jgi:hypothetical protein
MIVYPRNIKYNNFHFLLQLSLLTKQVASNADAPDCGSLPTPAVQSWGKKEVLELREKGVQNQRRERGTSDVLTWISPVDFSAAADRDGGGGHAGGSPDQSTPSQDG